MKKTILSLLAVLLFINAHAQTQQQIENQIAFTKLYGYVRYFHPSDEAADIDWERFAIYGSKKVADCKNQQQLEATLLDLFSPIAPTLQISNKNLSFNKQQVIPPSLNGYKTIAWQHIGVGLLNDKRSPYQSARTNRNITFNQAPIQPGILILSGDDVKPYLGKQFKLEGRAKMANGSGDGHFWARVDTDNPQMGFFNNMNENPITDSEWQNYTISGKIDSNAVRLATGAFLVGDGEFWFNDFKVSVLIGGEWKEIFNYRLDNKKPRHFNSNAYAKDAIPEYTFSIIENTADASNRWTSIKRIPKISIEKHTTYFDNYPAVGEFIKKQIGGGLSAIIPLALYGNQLHTYPQADTVKLLALKKGYGDIEEKSINGNELNTRLADLCIAWNVFQHFHPYMDALDINWPNALKEAITAAYLDKTGYDFQKTLQKFTAKLRDGHINVTKTTGDKNAYVPPIAWEWVEGKLVVTNILEQSANLKRGDIITLVNGITPEEHFKAVAPYIAAGPAYLNYRLQTESLRGDKDTELRLNVLSSEGKSSAVVVKRTLLAGRQLPQLQYGDIKTLSNDITYLNIGSASMKTIDSALPQLQNSKVIICDLRGYPRDNTNFIEYLLSKKDTAKWMQIPRTTYPDREKTEFVKEGWNLKPSKPHLNAKIIFLTDGRAISYAESYMGIIEHYKLATIIGQPTAGTNGNVNWLSLPGGYKIVFTGMKVLKLDGSPHYGVGTKPDIYVNKTIKGVREGRDEFLEKAIEVAEGFNK